MLAGLFNNSHNAVYCVKEALLSVSGSMIDGRGVRGGRGDGPMAFFSVSGWIG